MLNWFFLFNVFVFVSPTPSPLRLDDEDDHADSEVEEPRSNATKSVWDHFDKTADVRQVKCKHCLKMVSRGKDTDPGRLGTSALNSHLKNKHKQIHEVLEAQKAEQPKKNNRKRKLDEEACISNIKTVKSAFENFENW